MRALVLAVAATLALSTGAMAQSEVTAPWDGDETIVVNSSVVPGVLVMKDEDFCRAMSLLLLLYQDDAVPSDEQIAKCAEVISGQMVTQAWMPQTWSRLIDPAKAPAPPTKVTGPMTIEQAGDYYRKHVRRHNLVNSRWGCAFERSRNGLTWKQDQRWAKRMYQAERRWMRSLRAVEWPKAVAKKVDRLLDRNATSMLWDKRVFNHNSYAAAVRSGDYAKRGAARSKTSEAAQQVRLALGIPAVPEAASDCKQVKRLEKLIGAGG